VTALAQFEPGRGRVVLIVVAHADDPALFLGGTIARWADAGWKVVVVRATDDRWDSVALSEADTVASNAAALRASAAVLGVAEIVEFGMATDVLGDASEVQLRERIIREVRRWKPYALVTFDPYAMFGEDNQDHVKVGAATDESFWTSQFDKHHPEHLDEGLEPHGCFERWYFGRKVVDITDVVDIGSTLERKIEAALCHEAALRNIIHQLRLQARTGGWQVELLDEAQHGDLRPFVDRMLRADAQRVGAPHGLAAAEEFRMVRFGGLAPLLEAVGTKLRAGS
jgi:LmbE family N-acetylglucosaminyl deacetylase